MTESSARRRPTKLSAETKWEIFLQWPPASHPGRRGPQVACGRVHDHRDPPHREGRRPGSVGSNAGSAAPQIGRRVPPTRRHVVLVDPAASRVLAPPILLPRFVVRRRFRRSTAVKCTGA